MKQLAIQNLTNRRIGAKEQENKTKTKNFQVDGDEKLGLPRKNSYS